MASEPVSNTILFQGKYIASPSNCTCVEKWKDNPSTEEVFQTSTSFKEHQEIHTSWYTPGVQESKVWWCSQPECLVDELTSIYFSKGSDPEQLLITTGQEVIFKFEIKCYH